MKTEGFLHRTAWLFGTAVLRHFPRLRASARGAYWALKRKRYERIAQRTPTDEKLVYFESFGGRSCGDSPRAIYQAMLSDERFSGHHFVWGFKTAELVSDLENDPFFSDGRTRLVLVGSAEYFDVIASAGYNVQNMRLPEFVYPKEDQVFVQCWHGTPLKRLGDDIKMKTTGALNSSDELAERYRIDGSKWTYLVSPSPYATEHLSHAFGLSDQRRAEVALEVGYPRNDELVWAREDSTGERRRIARSSLGIPHDKKVLLYAPTWRDDAYQVGVGYTLDYLADFALLQKGLGDGWVVLFRPHYLIGNRVDLSSLEGFVYDVADWPNINDLFISSDVLVTDYSSVMFDYADLRQPIMLYVPDFERYASDTRGFYFNISEIPGPCCASTNDLVEALGNLDEYWKEYGPAYDAYVGRFCPRDDGHASERVIDCVWGSEQK